MEQQNRIFVKEKHNGQRLDLFLMAVLVETSRPIIHDLIQSKMVRIDGKITVKASLRLRPGMVIRLSASGRARQSVKVIPTESIPVPRVIAETEKFLVLDKPAGIAMHPAGNSQRRTVSDWISTTYPHIIGIGEDKKRPGMVHRLDQDTSGLVIIAKTNRSFKALKKLFQEREIEKTYFALVYGNVHEPSGRIDLPIGRIKGEKKRAVPAGNRLFGGELRDAITEYTLQTRYTGYDYLSIKPKTGRTHQIRVHLAALGHPIVGDRLYRFKEHRYDPLKPTFQLLHAGELHFKLGKQRFHYLSPLPIYFTDTLKMLDQTSIEDGVRA